jgi:hypothetical protein
MCACPESPYFLNIKCSVEVDQSYEKNVSEKRLKKMLKKFVRGGQGDQDAFVKKTPKNVAQPVFKSKLCNAYLSLWKKQPNYFVYFCNFQENYPK